MYATFVCSVFPLLFEARRVACPWYRQRATPCLLVVNGTVSSNGLRVSETELE